jgi:hypothetical protein
VSAVYAEPPSAAYEEMREIALKAGLSRGVNYSGSRETVVAQCRMHQLIARKPMA